MHPVSGVSTEGGAADWEPKTKMSTSLLGTNVWLKKKLGFASMKDSLSRFPAMDFVNLALKENIVNLIKVERFSLIMSTVGGNASYEKARINVVALVLN